MSDSKKSTFDWKTFLASAVVAAILSIPSWLPVFGIEFEWFGYWLVVAIQRSLPLIGALGGFTIGWNARKRSDRAMIANLENELEKRPAQEQIDEMLAEKDTELEKHPMPEELEKQRRVEVLAKIGATSDDLSPAAFSILEKMTDAEATCLVALANVAQLANGTSDPESPLVSLPVSDYHKRLGITDDLIDRLENAGVVVKTPQYTMKESADSDTPLPALRFATRSSTGPIAYARDEYHKIDGKIITFVARPPLKFTPFGKELASICKTESYPDAVAEFLDTSSKVCACRAKEFLFDSYKARRHVEELEYPDGYDSEKGMIISTIRKKRR